MNVLMTTVGFSAELQSGECEIIKNPTLQMLSPEKGRDGGGE